MAISCKWPNPAIAGGQAPLRAALEGAKAAKAPLPTALRRIDLADIERNDMRLMPPIAALDHFVLTVASIEETCAFYRDALGMEAVTFGSGRKALLCGGQKINLHEAGREFEPKAHKPTPGAGDFCLVTEEDLGALAQRLGSLGIAIEEGPVARTGARGPITSIYLRDPDGNLVEVARYDD